MLIVKAFVNEYEIDEIWIWNTGRKVDDLTETYQYKILKPEGYEDVPIYHDRDKGWKDLFYKVLAFIDEG